MDISIDFYEDSSHSYSDSNSGRRRSNGRTSPTTETKVAIKTSGEYNLRPRRCKRAFDPSDCLRDNANSPTENADPKSDPFAAIPSTKRRKKSSGRGAARNNKSKAPPLSKYRRKTANARERNRMQEINLAFERLRNAVPQLPPSHLDQISADPKSPEPTRDVVVASKGGSPRKSKLGSDKRSKEETDDENCKMTKITTLRLAVNYIAALSQILAQSQRENGVKISMSDSNCSSSRDPQKDSEISSLNSRDDTDSNNNNKGKNGCSDKMEVASELVSSSTTTTVTCAPSLPPAPHNFADYFASTVQGHKSRVSNVLSGDIIVKEQVRDVVKEAFLGSDSEDPIGVSTTTISDEDLREFEEEYCPGVVLNRDPLTDDDLALIPDEAFVREFFSLHANAPGQQDDVFRLVATHHVDFV